MPWGHFLHSCLLYTYSPSKQLLQVLDPLLENCPFSQSIQSVGVVDLYKVLYFPDRQFKQFLEPIVSEYFPWLQLKQLEDPNKLAKVPFSHNIQLLDSIDLVVWPYVHNLHIVDPILLE